MASKLPSPSGATVLPGNTLFDISKLGEENYDVEAYVRNLLQKLPNEEAVQQMRRTMQDSKDSISRELQRNVYKNYNEFVIISKEISKLEGDMIGVRHVLSELKEVRDRFKVYAKEDVVSNRKSILISPGKPVNKAEEEAKQKAREEAEKEQRQILMKNMYRDVEGLQKMLPESSTRELMLDGTAIRISEVNSNTYKVKELVFLHVLSDYLIQVGWKKNIMSGKNRLVVDKGFPINEIGVIDMKDSPELMNAFKILKGAETFIFKAETLQEKKSVLSVITKITSDLVALKKSEITQLKSPITGTLPPMPISYEINGLVSKNKKQVDDGLNDNDYRWLLELSDELDVLIAQRDFGIAIDHIERARKILDSCTSETIRLTVLRSTIEERVTNLSRLISIDLTSPAATKSQIQDDIDRLLRLGLGDQARDIYLTSRSSVIRHRVRQLQFGGDTVSYMIDYSDVFFKLIRNTCEWFGVSFHDPSMASGFMKWIQKEVTEFSHIFRKQTFQMQHEFHIIADCVITVTGQCQSLSDIGLDITSFFDKLIQDDLIAAIEDYARKCDFQILEAVKADNLELLEPAVELFEDSGVRFDVPIPRLTKSALVFYETLSLFGSDVGALMSFSLYNTVVNSLRRFFTTFIDSLIEQVGKPHAVPQYMSILANASFVVEKILQTTKSQLTERFERSIPELIEAVIQLGDALVSIRDQALSQIFNRLTTVEYNFQKLDYSSTAAILDNVMPTTEMLNLAASLLSLFDDNQVLNSRLIVSDLLLEVFQSIESNASNWVTPKGPRKFGFGGIQQLMLDMTFILRVFEEQITEESNDLSNTICEKALKSYFTQNPNVTVPLKNGDFYESRTEATMKKLGLL